MGEGWPGFKEGETNPARIMQDMWYRSFADVLADDIDEQFDILAAWCDKPPEGLSLQELRHRYYLGDQVIKVDDENRV